VAKGCSALKFEFDKEVGRSGGGTGLNETSPGMASDRVGVGKIVKFIHIGRKSFMRQENRFKKAAFGRQMSQKKVVPEVS
jgi:hypothetical protein